MHPILGHWRRLGAYATAAVPIAALVAGLLIQGPGGLPVTAALALAIPLAVGAIALLLPVWYACRSLPVAETPRGRLLLTHALGAAATSFVWVYLGTALSRGLGAYAVFTDLPARHAEHVPTLFASGVLLYVLAAVFHYLLLAVESAQRAERGAVEAAMLAREAELRALKAQVHPHFLFNSLNSISALTTSDPARAREMCVLLAEFFRRTLALGERASVSLEEELDVARTYLAIERLRLGARLRVEETIDEAGRACRVPPLILQPLVENAIRHGIATRTDGGVLALSATADGGRLFVQVENPFDPDAPARPGIGLGISNVRRRLLARYGEAGVLEAQRAGELFRVTLQIPVETAP